MSGLSQELLDEIEEWVGLETGMVPEYVSALLAEVRRLQQLLGRLEMVDAQAADESFRWSQHWREKAERERDEARAERDEWKREAQTQFELLRSREERDATT